MHIYIYIYIYTCIYRDVHSFLYFFNTYIYIYITFSFFPFDINNTYRSCLRQGSAPGQGGNEDLKAVGGGEGQVARYFLLRWVTKNMKIRKEIN